MRFVKYPDLLAGYFFLQVLPLFASAETENVAGGVNKRDASCVNGGVALEDKGLSQMTVFVFLAAQARAFIVATGDHRRHHISGYSLASAAI